MSDAANWREMRDVHGRVYYANTATQQTQWDVPASWQQHRPPAQHQPIHTLPLHSHSQQQPPPPAPHQQHGPTLGGLVSGALHSASNLKDKVSHAGVVLKDKVSHAGVVYENGKRIVHAGLAHLSAFETAVDDNEYWSHVDNLGHLQLQSAPADKAYGLKLHHEKELLNDRILWTGSIWRDFLIYTRTNHPLLSVVLVDPLHPFSRTERFFHGLVTVLYSVIMGHICLSLSLRAGYCTDDQGLIDIRSTRDARCANLQFWLQVAIIMIPLLIFDKIIYSFATCSCCISVNRSVRGCCEKLGGCFFYFVIFLGIASTSFGIAFVVSSPRQTPYSCAFVPDGCRDSMLAGFATGRLLGYVTWFLEAVPVFWWNYKLKRQTCEGCACHSCCCCCFGVAAVADDNDPRVAMLKGNTSAAQAVPTAVPNHMAPH